MERQSKGLVFVVAMLVCSICVFGIAFAATAYNQDLSVTGTANVAAAKWDVHFDKDSYSLSTGSVEADSYTLTNSSMQYEVTLTEPGDFYEFTVIAKNEGTFNAELTGITMTALNASQSKYLTYTVTYDGTTYSSTNNSLSGSILAKTNGAKNVVVRVEYVQPTNEADLPTEDQKITLEATLSFAQAE